MPDANDTPGKNELEAEIRRLREGWDGWQQQAIRAEDRCAALERALERYGAHLAGCPARDARTHTLGCRCGLAEALAAAPAREEEAE